MKPDIKEAVMSNKKARMYAYLSAEITSLYHEAAVKMGISDTVLNILYVLLRTGWPVSPERHIQVDRYQSANNQFGNSQIGEKMGLPI